MPESTFQKVALAALGATALFFGGYYFCAVTKVEVRGFEKSSVAMGTFVTISVNFSDEGGSGEVIEAAFAEMRRLDGILSGFDEESDVSAINRAKAGEPVQVERATTEVFYKAIEVSKRTGGAFDVTVGPLVAVWKEAGMSRSLPEEGRLEEARGKVGGEKLALDAGRDTVTVLEEGVRVDLGGIAKGFIAEHAARVLRERGVNSGYVDAGGDIVFIGESEDGKPWRTGVGDPRGTEAVADILYVRDRAVVTSGNYQQFCEIEGKRYSHIIDARTGVPAEGPDSVTVVALDGATADAWATALSVLGRDGEAAAAEAGVEFLMYFVREGRIERYESKGFGKYRAESGT